LSPFRLALPSRRAGWLLLVASPLTSYHRAPPTRPLVVPADRCMSSCCPIVLRGPLVLSLRRLVVTCRVTSVAISSCAAPAPLPLAPYRIVMPSRPLSASITLLFCAALLSSPHVGWMLHVYPVHGLLGGGGRGLLMVSRLPAFALARISTVAVRTIAPWCRQWTPDHMMMMRCIDIISRKSLARERLACVRTLTAAVQSAPPVPPEGVQR